MNTGSRKPLTTEEQRRLAYFNERRDAMVSTIRELVEIESPSDNKAAVDRIAEAVARKFPSSAAKSISASIQRKTAAITCRWTFPASRQQSQYCSSDITTPSIRSALSPRCPAVPQTMLTGPGVLDMKSGIALMLHALAALQDWHKEVGMNRWRKANCRAP